MLLVYVYLQILLSEKFYIPAEIFATEPEFSFEYRFYHFIPIWIYNKSTGLICFDFFSKIEEFLYFWVDFI